MVSWLAGLRLVPLWIALIQIHLILVKAFAVPLAKVTKIISQLCFFSYLFLIYSRVPNYWRPDSPTWCSVQSQTLCALPLRQWSHQLHSPRSNQRVSEIKLPRKPANSQRRPMLQNLFGRLLLPCSYLPFRISRLCQWFAKLHLSLQRRFHWRRSFLPR